jgi:hypothetical protein
LKYFGIDREVRRPSNLTELVHTPAVQHQPECCSQELFTVCVLDNRGAGFSDVPAGRWRTSDMATDVIQ